MAKKTTATQQEVVTQINPYEFMLILNPELRETEINKKLKEIVGMIEKAGGKIIGEDFWGKKTLAYRMNKFDEGIYMVYNIEMPNTFLKEFKDHLRIEKEVLRSMIISLPTDHVYTKYDIEGGEEEPRKRVIKKKITPKPAPVAPVVKEEKVEAEPEEKKPKDEEPTSDDTAETSEDAVETDRGPSPEKKEEKKEEAPAEEIKKEEAPAEEVKEEEEPAEPEPAPEPEKEKEEEKIEEPAPEPEEAKEKEEDTEETKERKEEEKEYESELDKKLDAILGDEDLNL